MKLTKVKAALRTNWLWESILSQSRQAHQWGSMNASAHVRCNGTCYVNTVCNNFINVMNTILDPLKVFSQVFKDKITMFNSKK